MSNHIQTLSAAIEALLFIHGEPMEVKKIASVLNSTSEKVWEAIAKLQEKYADSKSGLILVSSPDEVQLATKPEFGEMLKDFIKEEFEENLSPASLETLSLVAYLGPIPRSSIEHYRGVNSSFILRNLLLRGLVERMSDPKRGNTFLYRPSFDLLKYLGIAKIEELPRFEKFKSELFQVPEPQEGMKERP